MNMAVPKIPNGFAPIVKKHLYKNGVTNRNTLDGCDFSWDESVVIRFPDGSHAMFRYAFFLEDPVRELVAVFTEHCGYHVYSSVELEIESVKKTVRGSRINY